MRVSRCVGLCNPWRSAKTLRNVSSYVGTLRSAVYCSCGPCVLGLLMPTGSQRERESNMQSIHVACIFDTPIYKYYEQRERERETERQRERERERERETETDRQTDRQRQRDRETGTETDRQTETERERQRKRQRHREHLDAIRPAKECHKWTLKVWDETINSNTNPQKQAGRAVRWPRQSWPGAGRSRFGCLGSWCETRTAASQCRRPEWPPALSPAPALCSCSTRPSQRWQSRSARETCVRSPASRWIYPGPAKFFQTQERRSS